MWDLIVSVPDHCLSLYFVDKYTTLNSKYYKVPTAKTVIFSKTLIL